MKRNFIAECICEIKQEIPQTESKVIQQLDNIATQFNQIVITETEKLISLLKQALSDQICASYQYWSAQNMTRGTGKADADPQFEAHAYEQWEHARMLIQRIKQLGGFPFFNLQDVFSTCTSHAACGAQSHNVCELLQITIQAQKDAIQLYKNIIKCSQGVDPTTHQIAKKILADQQQHLYDLTVLLEDIC